MAKVYNRLPNDLFSVKIPLSYVYTPEEMEIYGIPIEEDRYGRINPIDEKFTMVKLPLTRIIDIYSSGAPIYLVNGDEVYRIYKILEEYLGQQDKTPVIEFNAEDSIEEDRMTDIDRFAQEVFNLNKDRIAATLNNETRTGFDIGLPLFDVQSITNVQLVKGRTNVTEAYRNENPILDTLMVTSREKITPDQLKRTPRSRRRRVVTYGEEQ